MTISIWSHAHFVTGQKPEEFVSPQVYGFKSPKGQIIIVDDRDDVEKIIINHGENVGLVKVIELTEMLNKIEDKVNEIRKKALPDNVPDNLLDFNRL